MEPLILGVRTLGSRWQTLLAATGGVTRDTLPRRFHTGVSVAGHVTVLAMAALVVVR